MKVEKRINEIVNRLNKTKVERKPDLKGKVIFIFKSIYCEVFILCGLLVILLSQHQLDAFSWSVDKYRVALIAAIITHK